MHKKLKLYIVGKEMLDRMSTALCSSVIDFWIVLAGVFWIACEATLQLLRDNKDSLMNPGRLSSRSTGRVGRRKTEVSK